MNVTECLKVLIEEFFSPVTLNIFWRAKKSDPVKKKSFNHSFTFFIVDKASRFEFSEGVHHVKDIRRCIFIADVLLQIYTEEMVEAS